MRITVLDCETTGLDARDEIVELGIIQFDYDGNGGLRELSRYWGLREPKVEFSAKAREVNGISDDEIRGKELDHVTVTSLIESSDAIIAHNSDFDKRFVSKLFPAAKKKSWYCSCKGIDWTRAGCSRRSLVHIAEKLGVPGAGEHRAVEDCEVLIKCLTRPVNGGERTFLQELLDGESETTERETYSISLDIPAHKVPKEKERGFPWVPFAFLAIVLVLAFKLASLAQ